MLHSFIINPNAGKGKVQGRLVADINSYCAAHGVDYEIYVTKCAGDGTRYVRERAQQVEKVRFYAVGGDGTLYEVVNGAAGLENVEVGIIPIGSGNDFIRLFGGKGAFSQLDAQINGTPVTLDLIRCGEKFAINQCSMGFDAEVCAKQAEFKKVRFLSGETAYLASLVYCLLHKLGAVFTIKIDDDDPFTKNVLFCVGANSRWYGGGFQCAPKALPDDGKLDVVVLSNEFSRLKLFSVIFDYKKGKHLSWPITTYRRANRVSISSEKPAAVNVDGECEYVHESEFELVPGAIRFNIPTVSTYIADRQSGRLGE
ncbi:MAG: diacylglycerol kinase family lipid kinase [Clostridia bacterium]|nr:diacylglycerol kinase family lipid kinase [Clostridia bacterium]